MYRLRHFSGGTSVIRSSLSLLAAPSSRCDGGGQKRTLERARALGRLSRDTLNALCQARFFFFFFGFNFPTPLPLQLVILQVATASLELPQTGSGGPLPPSTHPLLPASKSACDIFSRLPCGIFALSTKRRREIDPQCFSAFLRQPRSSLGFYCLAYKP